MPFQESETRIDDRVFRTKPDYRQPVSFAENLEIGLMGASGLAVIGAGLWWMFKRRQTIGQGTVRGLGVAEHHRRRATKAISALVGQIRDEADKRANASQGEAWR
jgi:hypothetical protein